MFDSDQLDYNVISLCSAGGGKTTQLISRVQSLLKNNLPETKILILSLTNSTCKDISNRCKVEAMTLHSFVYQFLNKEFILFTSSKSLVERFIYQYELLSDLGVYQISKWVDSFFIFDKLDDAAKDNINQEFHLLIKDIKREKEKQNIIFFTDLINIFYNNIDNFLPQIYNQYDHILVDESQDFTALQLKIIFLMIEKVFLYEKKSFFIIGDYKQSIYSFQGSDIYNYLAFIKALKILCKKFKRKLLYQKNHHTYRFGGDILKKINTIFPKHISSKSTGIYKEIYVKKQDFYSFMHKSIQEESKNNNLQDIMILYSYTNSTIYNLQNQLNNYGVNQKIYLQYNKLIEHLKLILYYKQTGHLYYKIRIIHSSFMYIEEPNFYHLFQNNKIEKFKANFFNLLYNTESPTKILKFLCKYTLNINNIDALLLQELILLSYNFITYEEFIFHLPESIEVQKEGLLFSTIHSAKGLEAKVVFFIRQFRKQNKQYLQLDPFKISTTPINCDDGDYKQLMYVVHSRAKEKLYVINIE